MDRCLVQVCYDSMVPGDQEEFEGIQTSTEDWFQRGLSGFENDGLPRKHSGVSAKANLEKWSPDTRRLPVKESKDHHAHLHDGSSTSCANEVALSLDCSTDDLFNDLPDFEMQDSLEFTDDIFLNPFLEQEQDLMHLDNPYESLYAPDSMHVPWISDSLLATELEDCKSLMNDQSRRKSEDTSFGAGQMSPNAEYLTATIVGEPVCLEAATLQGLVNVMLQLDKETRICIRDALYRLASSSKEQHKVNLNQNGRIMDRSCSEAYGGTSGQESSRWSEPKTNVIDRAIATLMFDSRQRCRTSQFPFSLPFCKDEENAAASGSCDSWSSKRWSLGK